MQQVEALGGEEHVDVGDEVGRRGDELQRATLAYGVGGAGEEEARVGLAGQEHRLALTGEHGLHATARLRDGVVVAAGRDHGDAVPCRGEPLDEGLHLAVHPRGPRPQERREDTELVAHAVYATPPRSGATDGRRRAGRRRTRRRPAQACSPAPPRLGTRSALADCVGAGALAGDELFGQAPALVVGMLHRRRLHEVAAGTLQRAGEAPVEADLGAAHRVDDDPGAVGRVDHFKLEFDVERHVAEVAALHADVGPLAVLQPLDVVARADVDVLGAHVVVELAGDGVGLADLLGLKALALEHVEEVGVSAYVELAGTLELDAALAHKTSEDAVHDGGADLALDVVADDRHAGLDEALLPVRLAGEEHRDAVDHGAAGGEDLLRIPLGGLFAADGEVVDHDVGLRLLEDTDDVGGGTCLLYTSDAADE